MHGRYGDGRCRVPPGWFKNDFRWKTGAPQLLGSHEAVFIIAYHQCLIDIFQIADPFNRGLEQALVSRNRNKLLGIKLPGERPKPCA